MPNTQVAVKFVKGSTTEVEGFGMPYGGPHNGRDLAGEFFDENTEFAFGWGKERPMLYGHGLDPDTELEPIGYVKSWEKKDQGVWVRGQLEASNEYFESIKRLVEDGKLYFSSGAMQHLVKTDKATGRIKVWPWVELSLTTSPCNLLATAASAEKHFKALGLSTDGLKAIALSLKDAPTTDPLPDSYYLHADAVRSVGRYRDDTGTVDASLLDAAVQEVDASDLSEESKVKALSRARAVSREHGFTAVTTVVSTEPLKAVWSTAFVDSLSDNAFLYVEPGGKKSDGKTEPRSNRHFPYKDADNNVDLPHLRNALSRIPDSSLPADIKERVVAKARRLAKANGIGEEGAKAYMKVFDKARIKVMGGGDDDGESEYEGSYEDLIDDLRDLLNPSDPWAESGYSSVICTYPTYFVCSKWVGGEQTFWRFPYEINDVGEPVLGSPIEVQQTYIPVKTSISTGPLALDARKTAQSATALIQRTEDLYERRVKDGRVFSSSNATELSGCADQCEAAATKIRTLLENTRREAQEAAKAAFMESPDGRAMRLRVLELAVPTPA